MASKPLTPANHDRDSAGLTYVYPVVSRRSGGLSIGVNLNPNNACNWRCVYCQVPDLRRGAAPPTDLGLLERELRGLLDDALHGDFYQRFQVPPAQQAIRDIALSGNGEPTSSAQFPQAAALIGQIAADFGLGGPRQHFKLVLISNGSLMRRENVRAGLKTWAAAGGEVWFKLDSATALGTARINSVHASPESRLRNLQAAADLCPTWLQTCAFAIDGQPPAAAERQAYLAFLRQAQDAGIALRGVLLYGLARPSQQPEAPRLAALPVEWMESFAAEIRGVGVEVRLSL
ncbi:MAG: radical SAM protein [Candidatus Methylumidiphilus sp.]